MSRLGSREGAAYGTAAATAVVVVAIGLLVELLGGTCRRPDAGGRLRDGGVRDPLTRCRDAAQASLSARISPLVRSNSSAESTPESRSAPACCSRCRRRSIGCSASAVGSRGAGVLREGRRLGSRDVGGALLGAEEQVGQVAGERAEDADPDDDDERAQDASRVGHRVLVAVADRRDRRDDVPERIRRVHDVGTGRVVLDRQHPQAAELEHQDRHEEQAQQGAAGPLGSQAPPDVADAVLLEEPVDPDQAEDAQDLELGDGHAGQQVGPAEVAEEVVRPGLGGLEPHAEVHEQDQAQQPVHDQEHVVEVLVVHERRDQQVEDREDRQRRDEDLVARVLELGALRVVERGRPLDLVHRHGAVVAHVQASLLRRSARVARCHGRAYAGRLPAKRGRRARASQ